jgi:hypothetical protein
VRSGLLRRAREISDGRAKIERELIRLVDYYRDQKHYDLELTSGRLDAYLFRLVRIRSMANIGSLYTAVSSGKLSPERLARDLISQDLASILVSSSDTQLTVPLHRIDLCNVCRPIPGDPILATERRVGTSATGLIVHHRDCKIGNASRDGAVAAFDWSQAGDSNSMLVEYEIAAENRYRLLGETLDIVYSEPGVHLYKVEAQSYNERPAQVFVTAEVTNSEQASKLHSQLELVRGVEQVFSYPVANVERWVYASSHVIPDSNPYDESAVFQRYTFYDREEQAQRVESWLKEPIPTRVMILHGQRRVGKSSLAKFLMIDVGPAKNLAAPVYIDLHGLSAFAPIDVARYLLGRVFETLGLPPPAHESLEEPTVWLSRGLQSAVEHLGDRRLLLIIDEFNYLLDLEQDGKVDPVVFYNLRAVIGERRDLHWLMIVQDVRFKDLSSWGSAGSLFQQAVPLHVPNLDSHWARKLIVEPAGQAGFSYDGQSDGDRSRDVASLAFDLTAGNPYFIQALCRNMLDQARRQRRTNVTMSDLKTATSLVLSDGPRYFDHFLRSLDDTRNNVVVSTIARISRPVGKWVQRAELVRELPRGKRRALADEIDGLIARLARVGILETRPEGKFTDVRIAVPIFHEWASLYLGSVQSDTVMAGSRTT